MEQDYLYSPEYAKQKEKRAKRRKKRNKKDKQPWFWKLFFTIVLMCLVAFVISITEIGCKFYQNYVDDEMKSLVNEAMRKDDVDVRDPLSIYYWQIEEMKTSKSFRGAVDAVYTKKDWLPWLQWKIAEVHRFFGRGYWQAKAYGNYHRYFHNLDKDKTVEAEFWELSGYFESAQFKTCKERIDLFYDRHETETDNPWMERVQVTEKGWIQLPRSKQIADDITMAR